MSHISFPGAPSASTSHDGQFFGGHGVGGGFSDGSSSFQMNPLSSHPPRTPRPSNVSSSVHHVYGGQIYEDKTETGSVADDTELAEEDAEATRLSATVIRKERVLQDMLLTSNGRDKVFVRQFLVTLCLCMYEGILNLRTHRRN